MRIVELLNNLTLSITNEESDVLGKFMETAEIFKADLSPREVFLANQLVNKDVLYRINENGRIVYKKKIK